MDKLKPEDVMRELGKIVSDPNCTNMRYIEGCGHFCKVFREPIDDMAGGRSPKCNEHCEHYSSPYVEGLIRAALAILREKDAEIERLKDTLADALVRAEIAKAETITEFENRLVTYYNSLKSGLVAYHIEQVAKEMRDKL
jgi:hypothetical protein